MGYISVGRNYRAGDVVNGRRTDGNWILRTAVHTLPYIVQYCVQLHFIDIKILWYPTVSPQYGH